MRPSAIEMLEKPRPSPLAFQTSGGPSARPLRRAVRVSVEMPSRCSPRHWGHSEVGRDLAAGRLSAAWPQRTNGNTETDDNDGQAGGHASDSLGVVGS